jgi:hypothetical protein
MACLALLPPTLAALGCAGYFVGTQTLYRPDIYTVHVPVVESASYRRFMGERLSEALVKQIELKTPYKVVADPGADSILLCRIVSDYKFPVSENQNDEPRDIEFLVGAEATWRDRRGQVIFGPELCIVPAGVLEAAQSTHFVPEGGQSLSTAELEVINDLASQIVSRMEVPW